MEKSKKRILEYVAVGYFALTMDLSDFDIINTIARDKFSEEYCDGIDPVFEQDVLLVFSRAENATQAIDALIEKYKDE